MSCTYPEGCSCGATQWNRLESERNELDSMYHKVIVACLRCDPVPACKREDDQLEPPWEVIDRVRGERDALSAAVKSFVDRFRAITWGHDGDCGAGALVDVLEDAICGDMKPDVPVKSPDVADCGIES